MQRAPNSSYVWLWYIRGCSLERAKLIRGRDCPFLASFSLKSTQPPEAPLVLSLSAHLSPLRLQRLFQHLSDTIKISTWVAEILNGKVSQWEGGKEEIKQEKGLPEAQQAEKENYKTGVGLSEGHVTSPKHIKH